MTTASDGTTSISFTYDTDGLRTSKTVNGTTHTYLYASGKLLRETFGSNTLDFFYDFNGNAYALKYNGTLYYYITNLQGDVMSIVDETGTPVATYEYDPYGNIVTTTGTLAEVNPLRYRGYYFDFESGFYYLQSRYYDPELGRFINADAFASTGQGLLGNNMFAYCRNNPVFRVDVSGTFDEECNPDDPDELDPIKGSHGALGGSTSSTESGSATKGGTTGGGLPNSGLTAKIDTNNYAGNSGKTEVHHVVEQCQADKSGFSKSQIQSLDNKIELDYYLHRQISGYYSSKPPMYGGLKVRDWLAGQSFEMQTAFGWQVINKFYYKMNG